VPAGTAPGYYTGYLYADVLDRDTGKRWSMRLPALTVVEMTDADAGEGPGKLTEVEGFSASYFPTTFLLVVVADGVNSDWPMQVIDVPEGLDRLDLAVRDTSGRGDIWDLFVYDEAGMLVSDTYLAAPSTDASLSLSGLAPGRYRIAVSPTYPSQETFGTFEPYGPTFVLSADLVGAASPSARVEPAPAAPPAPAPAPAPRKPLPATGVGVSLIPAAVLLGISALMGRRLSRR
jgi:hypothetical protein